MNQEQVTTENTEEKAAEVTHAVGNDAAAGGSNPSEGKWFGRGFTEARMFPSAFWTA